MENLYSPEKFQFQSPLAELSKNEEVLPKSELNKPIDGESNPSDHLEPENVRTDIQETQKTKLDGNISFGGRVENERNDESSKFLDSLKSAGIYYTGFVGHSDVWGGFDGYTTGRFKEIIIVKRNSIDIDDRTYQKLMADLKKSSHYAND